jgi:UDP-N-acetyl-D-galactosamine dehydrogenase
LQYYTAAVPTPTDELKKKPVLTLIKASEAVAKVLKKGDIVIKV